MPKARDFARQLAWNLFKIKIDREQRLRYVHEIYEEAFNDGYSAGLDADRQELAGLLHAEARWDGNIETATPVLHAVEELVRRYA